MADQSVTNQADILSRAEQEPQEEAAIEAFETVSIAANRERLPATRHSITHKFSVSGTEGYIIVGVYEDGRPGELFLKVAKEGSTLGGLMDGIGILTSMGLQYGVPLAAIAAKMKNTQFDPAGHTSNPNIAEASSLLDYIFIFTWMEQTFSDEGRRAISDDGSEEASA